MSNSLIGSIDGDFSVDANGSAVYAIPITVPPGVSAATPTLTLVHNSQVTDGPLGVGWMLDGLSVITRAPATNAQDGRIASVAYADTDRLSLDGVRLMLASGDAYFAANAVYRTEMETWQRVTPAYDDGTNGRHGPTSFVAITREGHRCEYGTTADSRIAASKDNASVRAWYLSRATDLDGNYVTFAYDQDPDANEIYPARVNYTGNGDIAPSRSVRFTWETRPDVAPRYLGGYRIATARRLARIETFLGDDLVLSYALTYEMSASTKRSRLRAVTLADKDANALPSTVFAWQDGDAAIFNSPSVLPPLGEMAGGVVLPMDVDGDGRVDLVHARPGTRTQLTLTLYLTNADGSGFQPGVPIDTAGLLFGGQLIPLDVNGDGCMDLVYATDNRGQVGLTLFTAQEVPGTGWRLVAGAPNAAGPAGVLSGGHLTAADVDGDGLADLIYTFDDRGGLGIKVWFSNGSSFAPSPTDRTKVVAATGGECIPVDFNGDGRTDLAYAVNSSGYLELTLFVSAGRDGFVQAASSLPPGVRVSSGAAYIPVDVNGDGNWDIVVVRNDRGTIALRALLSTGLGFDPQAEWNSGIDYTGSILPAEINGIGRGDLVVVARSGATGVLATVLLSNGSTFDIARRISMPPSIVSGGTWLPVDLAGVGRTGLLYAYPDSKGALALASATPAGSQPDLAASITDGFGGTVTIDYRPMTDPRVYSKGGASQPGQVEPSSVFNNGVSGATYSISGGATPGVTYASRLVDFPRYLVASATRSDGRGAAYATKYFYESGRMDLGGRGWLGFARREVTDVDGGTTAATSIIQAFPGIGSPTLVEVHRTSDGALLHDTRITYHAAETAAHCWWHVQQSIIERSWTANAIDYTQEDTVLTFDDTTGNVLAEVERASTSNDEVYTTKTYESDLKAWRLGYCVEEIVSADAAGQSKFAWRRYAYEDPSRRLVCESHWDDQANRWLDFRYSYDRFGNRCTSADPAGDVETVAYDAAGVFDISRTSPPTTSGDRLVERIQYAPEFGVPIAHTDVNGVTTTQRVDGFGRVVETAGPDPSDPSRMVVLTQMSWDRDAFGPFERMTHRVDWASDDWYWEQTYSDALRRPIRTMHLGADGSSAVIVDRTFNGRDQVVSETLPHFANDPVLVTTTTYDELGRQVAVVQPDGNGGTVTTRHAYPNSLRIVIDAAADTPDQRRTIVDHAIYRGASRITRVTAADGGITIIAYDALGRVVSTTDPIGVTLSLGYDARNRRVAESLTQGDRVLTQRVEFDDLDRCIRTTDGAGSVTLGYDALLRLVNKSSDDGETKVTYDATPGSRGRASSIAMPNGSSYSFEYDAYGNEVATRLALDGSTYAFAKTYAPGGYLVDLAFPDGVIDRRHYSKGLALTEIGPVSGGAAYLRYGGFNAFGSATAISQGNATTLAVAYDNVGRPVQRRVSDASGATLFGQRYTWTRLGEVHAITDLIAEKESETFEYDLASRLVAAHGPYGDLAFAYDPGGNVVRKDGVTYEYRGYQLIRGTGANGHVVFQGEYDAAGDMTSATTNPASPNEEREFTYNTERRLIASGDVSFLYDHTGRRLVKKTTTAKTYYVAPDYEVTVLPDGGRLSTRYVGGAHGVTCHVTTGNAQHAVPGVPTDGTFYLVGDQVGSIRLQTDSAGRPITRVAYTPFGDIRHIDGPDTFRPKFNAREFDSETGLYYLGWRYYHPVIGRFVSADDMVDGHASQPDAFNRYAYARNLPTTFADPNGHNSIVHWIVDSLLLAAGAAITFATAGAGLGFAATLAVGVLGGTLAGMGESGLMFDAMNGAGEGSDKEWGVQLGIGAAVGAITAPAEGAASTAFVARAGARAGRIAPAAEEGVEMAGVATRRGAAKAGQSADHLAPPTSKPGASPRSVGSKSVPPSPAGGARPRFGPVGRAQAREEWKNVARNALTGAAGGAVSTSLQNAAENKPWYEGITQGMLWGIGLGLMGNAIGTRWKKSFTRLDLPHAQRVGMFRGMTEKGIVRRAFVRLQGPRVLTDFGTHAIRIAELPPRWETSA